jgi:3D (Asp-Asp-Asp) domain-containing protein
MKLFYGVLFLIGLVSPALAREEMVLARVTGYWAHGEGGSGGVAASNGTRLRVGHCAVDPKRIPYGSKVVFPDVTCTAVDTGPAVISRKSARFCGRTAAQKNALVIDRFFESKRDAVAWSNAHPQFMMVKILPPGAHAEPANLSPRVADMHSSPFLSLSAGLPNDGESDLIAWRLFNWRQM